MANVAKRAAKKQVKAIKQQTKIDKNALKQQGKVEKAQLQQDTLQQEHDLDQQRARQNVENKGIRQEAENASRYIPYNAQDRATLTHSTEDQPVSIRNTTPEQDVALQKLYQLLPQGIQWLNLPCNQSSFAPIANEARRNFSENTIPSLAERFAGLGRNSSGLQNTVGNAAAQFESQLAAQQAQHGLQEQSLQSNNLFNSLGAFLQPQQDTTIVPGSNSALRSGWNGVKGALYEGAKGYFGGGGGLTGVPDAIGGALKGLVNGTNQKTQQQSAANGSGVGGNSAGFGGVQKGQNNWQPIQNQLSTQQLAGAGYGLPDMGNPGALKFI